MQAFHTKIFETKDLAKKILNHCRLESEEFVSLYGRKPSLAVVLVGKDPSSVLYVEKKGKTCREAGVDTLDFRLDPSESFQKLVDLIGQLNERNDVDGILVQSPLPKNWNEREIQSQISPGKDVDGFHPENAGKLSIDANNQMINGLVPCTPAGVMEILKELNYPLVGKNAVVIGRSNIVGKPMALLLMAADATVTVCHSKTLGLQEICRKADLLVTALGQPRFITRDYLKPGAVLVDVGINRMESSGKKFLVGDVDRISVDGVASILTPVPNGVGPMTIAMLIKNTLRAAHARARH